MNFALSNINNNCYTNFKNISLKKKNDNFDVKSNDINFHGINIKKEPLSKAKKTALLLLNSTALWLGNLFKQLSCKKKDSSEKLINKLRTEANFIDSNKLETKDSATEKRINKIFDKLYNDIENHSENYKRVSIADSRGLPRHYIYYKGKLLMMECCNNEKINDVTAYLYLNEKITLSKQIKN